MRADENTRKMLISIATAAVNLFVAIILVVALLYFLLVLMFGVDSIRDLQRIMSASSEIVITLLIIVCAALVIVFFVMIVCWLCKDEGIMILPFEVAVGEDKYSGKAISQLLTAELLRICQIHDPNVEYKGITPIESERINMPEFAPTSESLTYTVSQLGPLGLGTTSIHIGPLIAILKKLWPMGDKGQVISGSLQRYGHVISMVACLEHKKIRAWKEICEIGSYSWKGDENIPGLAKDLSFKIIYDLKHEEISAKTWQGFRHFTEALEAYNLYNLSGSANCLERARAECFKAASSEIGYENLLNLLYNLGMEFSDKNELHKAEELLSLAYEINPDDDSALVGLGHLCVVQQKYMKALYYFEKATVANPKSSVVWYNKGRALLYLGRNEDALQASEKAIEINPKDALAWSSKGAVLIKQGKPREGLEACEKAIELNPSLAIAWNNKCLALDSLGQEKTALETRKKAAELRIKSAAIYIPLARYYRTLGKKVEKDEACKLAHDLIGKDPSIYNRACFEAVCGNPDNALMLLNTVLQINPKMADWASRDPDFEFIRDDPEYKERFKALLDEFSTSGEKGPK